MGSADDGKSHSIPNLTAYLTLAAFLGGLTFTGMVVIMPSDEKFDFAPFSSVVYYPEILISSIGVVSALFIFAAVIFVDSDSEKNEKKIAKYNAMGIIVTFLGFVGILILVPFLILPFSITGAIIVGIVELFILIKWLRILLS